MNNWHIKIEDCTEAQKERLKQVYGNECANFSFLAGSENLIRPVPTLFVKSELITPDEAFERLGLGESKVEDFEQYHQAVLTVHQVDQRIKELEQQLTAKPELQGIDWSIIEHEYNWLAQNKGSGTIDFYRVKPTGSNYAILATRPKPKYTSERIDSACELYSDYVAQLSSQGQNTMTFPEWLKEVGNE